MAEELTVTEFNQRVNSVICYSDGLRDVSVTGEISGYRPANASGHVYFNLKDSESVISCNFFRFAASRCKIKLQDGMKVTVFGSASYYAKGGKFGFNVESVSLYGKGELQKALEELTAKLLAEGIFDVERKREPPRYPKTIGVVTSATGAVIKDIIDTTARRFPVDILLAPAVVQGEDAPKSIINGIKILNEMNVDVIIVGRGGGSKEDLIAFNDESVVRAVFNSKVPIISAVGHATDKSLTDRAADKYAETPTAAAMIATPDKEEERKNTDRLVKIASNSLMRMISSMKAKFLGLESKILPNVAEKNVQLLSSNLRRIYERMDSALMGIIDSYSSKLQSFSVKLEPRRISDRLIQDTLRYDDVSHELDHSINIRIGAFRNKFENISSKMDGLSPINVLERGYAIITNDSGHAISSMSDISIGMNVEIVMKDGKAKSTIKEVSK